MSKTMWPKAVASTLAVAGLAAGLAGCVPPHHHSGGSHGHNGPRAGQGQQGNNGDSNHQRPDSGRFDPNQQDRQ